MKKNSAPKGPRPGKGLDMVARHEAWYGQNEAQARVLGDKLEAGGELTQKERDFLSWWNGYCAANPDPKRLPRYSTLVIKRDKDPME